MDWKLIEPYINDDFLVLIDNYAMFRIDWNSNIKWFQVAPYHHDISVGDNGDIYALVNLKMSLPEYCKDELIYYILQTDMVFSRGDIHCQLRYSDAHAWLGPPIRIHANFLPLTCSAIKKTVIGDSHKIGRKLNHLFTIPNFVTHQHFKRIMRRKAERLNQPIFVFTVAPVSEFKK